MLPSKGRVSSTNASGSKPRSNTKNDMISQPSSRSKKNKLEAHLEGLGHNLFSVGKFCDLDLEVAFRKHACFVWNLEGVDLLSGSCGSNLYTISMADMKKSSLIWLPKLKYTKDHLCSACQMRKSKKESHPHKPEPSTNEKLQMLHMDLCGPTQFLRTKDEALEIIVKFLKQAQVSLNATDLGKLQLKADIGIFISYSPSKKAYRIYNKGTRQIMETMNIKFDELTHMASEQHGSGPDL
ncbi:hypothetical protein Tco_1397931 [Tanacetum coccineum]